MAEESQKPIKITTNEEVIEELTKDFESSIVGKMTNSEKDSTVLGDTQECEETEHKNLPETKNDSDLNETVEESEALSEEKEDSKVEDDDCIDEEALKDAEMAYSDEEKQNLRKESEALKLQGNELFKKGEYRESAKLYTLGLRTCPLAFSRDRAMMYANRAAAKTKLELKVSAIEDCTKAVELDSNYLKAYFRRAQLYEETEKLDEALADYQKVLELDPLHREALYASKRLPEQIHERNEKMKAEMMGKLKDLGNMILRPFGLSTENFQLTQDPSSGGYSVSFKQNPR